MNFRFPRYVSDISILRAYQGTDGSHGGYDASHVPVKPDHYLRVVDGRRQGRRLHAWWPGTPATRTATARATRPNTTSARAFRARSKISRCSLGCCVAYAAMKPSIKSSCKSQIFGLANTLEVSEGRARRAARATNVVAERQQREREFLGVSEHEAGAEGGIRRRPRCPGGGLQERRRSERRISIRRSAGCQQSDARRATASACTSSLRSARRPRTASASPQFQERNWPQVQRGAAQRRSDHHGARRGAAHDWIPEGARAAGAQRQFQRSPRSPRRLAAGASPARTLAQAVHRRQDRVGIDSMSGSG